MPNAKPTTGQFCYCHLWDKSPETLENQGVPRGYCGLCEVCGKPGHTQHFPGGIPYTGSWCDKHYRRTLYFDPRGTIGFPLWVTIVMVVVGLAVYTILRK